MGKRNQARKVGNREPLSLRFLPATKKKLAALAKKEQANLSSFATTICTRYLEGRLRLKDRPPRLPEQGRKGTSVILDPTVELRLAQAADEREWKLAYLVRRLLEWQADGWLIDAVHSSSRPAAR